MVTYLKSRLFLCYSFYRNEFYARQCNVIFYAAENNKFFKKVVAFGMKLWYVCWLPKGGGTMQNHMKSPQISSDQWDFIGLTRLLVKATQEHLTSDVRSPSEFFADSVSVASEVNAHG